MENVKEYYDKLSNRYHELYGQEQGLKHSRALEAIGALRFNVVVDIGCGGGELLSMISGKGSMIVGLDFSRGMLEKAKRLRCENEELILADACHLPIQEESIDCVVSISVADHRSVRGIIREGARIARPGAMMIVSTFHPGIPPPNCLPSDCAQDTTNTRLSDNETMYFWTKIGR